MSKARLLVSLLFVGFFRSAAPRPSGIPVIDIGPLLSSSENSRAALDARRDVIRRIGDACRNVGFFAVENHGVDPVIIDSCFDAARRFFDLPVEKKEAVRDMGGEYPYGYEREERLEVGKRAGGEATNDDESGPESTDLQSPADLKETFSIGPLDSKSGMPSRRFPPSPSDLEYALTLYYSAMEDLARVLLRALACALELKEDFFDDKMDRHASALRCVNYPALEGAVDGCVRAGAHTDYGALTILRSGGPGLQVARDLAANEDKGSEPCWVDAPDNRGAFIVNLGDLMQRWTNDVWRSTLHRVVAVPETTTVRGQPAVGVAGRRQSVAFFVNVNNDAIIEPLDTCVDDGCPARYRSVKAGEYLMRKHLASQGAKHVSPAD